MSDVTVGMKLRPVWPYDGMTEIAVTELTAGGFRYLMRKAADSSRVAWRPIYRRGAGALRH
jgi:hypothetical protein